MDRPGKRYPLLIYKHQFNRLRNPALLAGICGGVLWWFAPGVPGLDNPLAEGALLALTIVSGLLFLYALVGPALSYLQCHPTHLQVSTPLYRVGISYGRVRGVRPVKFAPRQIRNSERALLQPFLGQTAIGVDLSNYPVSEKVMRFWLHPRLFEEDMLGLVFLARDWMELSREIESYRGDWKLRRSRK